MVVTVKTFGARYKGWHAWVGANGRFYASRDKTSPPVVFRGRTLAAVAAQVARWENRQRRTLPRCPVRQPGATWAPVAHP